jgi:hypothetical protein
LRGREDAQSASTLPLCDEDLRLVKRPAATGEPEQ